MVKKKIYVCFDFENDRALKNEIVAQSQKDDAPFKISNWSAKEDAKNPKWVKDAKYRITRCDMLVVLTGENTHQAPGVLKEIEIATGAKIKIVQFLSHPQSKVVEAAGKGHDWTWENVLKLLG